jgi:hypothetical protein
VTVLATWIALLMRGNCGTGDGMGWRGKNAMPAAGIKEPAAEGTPFAGDGERRNDHEASPGEGGGESGRAPMELAGVRARGS